MAKPVTEHCLKMPKQTKPHQLALFGHPVAHSQSPKIHHGFATQFGLSINYQLIDVTTEQLEIRARDFFIQGGVGANITVPHKQNIMPVLDHITDRAKLAGAVNTLFLKENQLWGDNTDGAGFVMDLASKNVNIKDKTILVIGAGGATKGIIPALLTENPKHIHIINRSKDKAIELANQFDHCDAITYDSDSQNYDLIIHATSIGHQGLCPELNNTWFHDKTIAYDLSYGKAAEPFLNEARKQGAQKVCDGLGMLFGQAALAFEIWFDQRPKIETI